MKCQFIVHHLGGFLGYNERCTRSSKIETLAKGLTMVRVCKIHYNYIIRRNNIGMESPTEWFQFDEEQ